MKRFISLLMCCIIALSFAACGKKNEEKSSPDVKQSDGVKESGKSEETNAEDKEGAGTGAQVLPQQSASEIESKIDEFNTTEDPERKEELRKELEEFLKQAEEMANQG